MICYWNIYCALLHLDCPSCDDPHSHCDDTTDGQCVCDEGYSFDLNGKCVKGIKENQDILHFKLKSVKSVSIIYLYILI